MAVALRAVRIESTVSFMFKLEDGDEFISEDLLEKILVCPEALGFLPQKRRGEMVPLCYFS